MNLKAVCLFLFLSAPSWGCDELAIVGQGELNKFFITVYSAELRQGENGERCLTLVYEIDIAKEQLLSATESSLEHLGFEDTNIEKMLGWLSPIYQDVTEGDRFQVRTAGDRADFYFNTTQVGSVDQPQFGERFLSIWLSEAGPNPSLGRALTGEDE